MSSQRPIFVLGCPRSGTTLLQLMLHSHRRIAIPPEMRFVLPNYRNRAMFGDLREPENRRKLAQQITGREQSRFYELGLSADDITAQIVDGPPTLGSAFGIVLRAYAHRFGKARWGEKRPSYHHHIGIIQRLFPDAQFVSLVRDGRDCVGSLKQMPWYEGDTYTAVSTWIEAVDNCQEAARRLGPETFHEMRYERLVADLDGELAALCAFLGEDYDPAMTEPYKVAGIAVPRRKTWHSGTHDQVTTARSGSWQERLEPWEIALCETMMDKRLRSLGYELSEAGRPGPAHLARYAREAGRRRHAAAKRVLRERRNLRRETGPVACQLDDEPAAGVPAESPDER